MVANEDTPAFVVDRHAPELTTRQAELLQTQWDAFWALRHDPTITAQSPGGSIRIGPGWLIHNSGPEALDGILAAGIISGELGHGSTTPQPEDRETHYCADFFVNDEERGAVDWLAYARALETGLGRIRKKRMESYRLPTDNNAELSFVVRPRTELEGLLSNSATGLDLAAGPLADWPLRFPYARPDFAARHRAVLVGVPANCIDYLIVGGQIAKDPHAVTAISETIQRHGLRLTVADTHGRALIAPGAE
jgi:hypothetical protein